MRIPNELDRFADLVQRCFDQKYLSSMGGDECFVSQIKEGKIYPIKWLLSEIEKSQLNEEDLSFLEELRQINF